MLKSKPWRVVLEWIYTIAMQVAKNTVAAIAVERVRKLALPPEPNTPCALPLPEPKVAPASAPLPCCSNTNTITANAEMMFTIQITVLKASIILYDACAASMMAVNES